MRGTTRGSWGKIVRAVIVFDVVALGVSACTLDWTRQQADVFDAASDVGVQDATSVDGGADGDETSPGDAAIDVVPAHDADAALDASTDGDADAMQVSDGGACDLTHPCGMNAYCAYPDRYCGSGQAGTCVPAPTGCADAALAPVCSCDSQVDLSSCAAAARGYDVSKQAACTTPSNQIRCGYRYCQAGSEACVQKGSDYSCLPLGTCVAGCLCTGVLAVCSGGVCQKISGSVYVTCP